MSALNHLSESEREQLTSAARCQCCDGRCGHESAVIELVERIMEGHAYDDALERVVAEERADAWRDQRETKDTNV